MILNKTTIAPLLVLVLFLSACVKDTGKQEKQKQSQKLEKEAALGSLVKYGIDTSSLVPQGLPKGRRAPEFKARTQRGDSVSLKGLIEDKPLVLMFYRGQWCPVCNKYLKQLEDSVNLIREAGARVVAVTPETPQNAARMRDKTNSSVTIIPDTSETIIEAYKVGFNVTNEYAQKIQKGFDVSIAGNNADKKARLPIPATYVINRSGNISWVFFSPDYKKRASVKAILEAVKQDRMN